MTEQVAAALETGGLERRHVSLKGHEVDALVIDVPERTSVPAGREPGAVS
jgi:hypothetical protein